jgi:hypothetical protein
MTIPLTQQQFDTCAAKLNAATVQGIQITGPAGVLKAHTPMGWVTLQYSYVEPNLQLDIIDKPFLLPASTVWEKVKEWFSLV